MSKRKALIAGRDISYRAERGLASQYDFHGMVRGGSSLKPERYVPDSGLMGHRLFLLH